MRLSPEKDHTYHIQYDGELLLSINQVMQDISEDPWGAFYWKAIAIALFAYPIFCFIFFLIVTLIKQLLPLPDLIKKYCSAEGESWAVVTGATDGIGLGFCEVLTKLGFNVLLISRNPEKLAKTIQNLEKLRPAQYKSAKLRSITFDFRNSGQGKEWQAMLQQLKGLDIAILVNNVGIDIIKYYHTYSQQDVRDVININCTSMAGLLPPVLENMIKRKTKSAVINLSSYLGQSSMPFWSIYSASKAFNHKLSQGIAYEYPNIDIMCIKPMFVESPGSRQAKGFLIPDRREMAYDSLKELRWSRDTYGFFSHRIAAYIFRQLIPSWVDDIKTRIWGKDYVQEVNHVEKVD